MKDEIREAQIWTRSAEQHELNGELVAALLSHHLAWQAQQFRNEYEMIKQVAEIQHKEAQ